MKRTLALDVGDRRIGIAASDLLGMTAQPVETYQRKKIQEDCAYIAQMAQRMQVDTIVLGLPLNMNGTQGPQAQSVRDFAQELHKACDLPLCFIDERLTTAAAHRTLIQSGMRREKRKKVVDQVAAIGILSTYLQAPQGAIKWEESI